MSGHLLSVAVLATLISSLPVHAAARTVLEAGAETGWMLELGLLAHAGISSFDYSGASNTDPDKENINDGLPYYYTGTVTADPAYRFMTTHHGPFELRVHSALMLDDAWLDNDQLDELSVEMKSDHYGRIYLGEDDGAADRLKPKQSGRVGLAVGHGAFTGIIPWWGNLPYGGGFDRDGANTWGWDWPNGIVGGDWRSTSRDTQDAIKIGVESPVIKGFSYGASINLQDTFAGFSGPGSAPKDQDDWHGLEFKEDEYELALQWHGKTAGDLLLSAGVIHSSVHVVNEDMLQQSTDVGFQVGNQLESGALVSTSLYYAYQHYDNDAAAIDERDEQVHLGADWRQGKWTVGVNYVQAWDSLNPAGTRLLGGGGNRGYSLGADYRLTKGLTLSGGVIYAENDSGEEAIEVGVNLSWRFRTRVH